MRFGPNVNIQHRANLKAMILQSYSFGVCLCAFKHEVREYFGWKSWKYQNHKSDGEVGTCTSCPKITKGM